MVTLSGSLTIFFGASISSSKPTVANSLFGMGMPMDEEGCRKLTVRCALFFFFLAACNEYVRRTQSWDT